MVRDLTAIQLQCVWCLLSVLYAEAETLHCTGHAAKVITPAVIKVHLGNANLISPNPMLPKHDRNHTWLGNLLGYFLTINN